MSPFVADYLVFAFWASVGAIQVGASIGRFDGLLFLKHRLGARVFGLALVGGAIAWFFLTDERNINDIDGGLDANQQAIGFFGGAAVAVIVTAAISSLINARMHRGEPGTDEGLEAMRKTSYLVAARRSLALRVRESFPGLVRFYSGDRSGIVFKLAGRLIVRAKQG
jgi:hypothetical protein